MVNTFFAILLFCFFCAVVTAFLSWCLASKRVRYQDWASEEKRKNLLETVRKVREEEGDYSARINTNRPASIRKSARVGPAKRASVRR